MTAREIEQVVTQTLSKLGLLKPYLSKSEAYRMYGRGTVDRWIREGWIKSAPFDGDSKRKDISRGSVSKKRYSRVELEEVAQRNNSVRKFETIK